MQKKVSFYFLSQEQTTDDKKKHSVSKEKIESNFNHIYNKMHILKDGTHAQLITHGNIKYVVEIIEYNSNSHCVFLKIGHQNHSSTVSIRDQHSLETTDVPMTSTERLELFTYCYIDFSTCVVSYIRVQGAPGITTLRSFFDEYLLSPFHTSSSVSAILSSDIIKLLNKKRISKLVVSVAVPNDDVLSEQIGVGKKTFDDLQYVNKINYTYSFSAKRLKSMFKDSKSLGNVVALIKDKHGKSLQSLSVNAADDSESSETYNLLLHSLTKKVTFDTDDMCDLTQDDFKTAIMAAYSTSKNDLIHYLPE